MKSPDRQQCIGYDIMKNPVYRGDMICAMIDTDASVVLLNVNDDLQQSRLAICGGNLGQERLRYIIKRNAKIREIILENRMDLCEKILPERMIITKELWEKSKCFVYRSMSWLKDITIYVNDTVGKKMQEEVKKHIELIEALHQDDGISLKEVLNTTDINVIRAWMQTFYQHDMDKKIPLQRVVENIPNAGIRYLRHCGMEVPYYDRMCLIPKQDVLYILTQESGKILDKVVATFIMFDDETGLYTICYPGIRGGKYVCQQVEDTTLQTTWTSEEANWRTLERNA